MYQDSNDSNQSDDAKNSPVPGLDNPGESLEFLEHSDSPTVSPAENQLDDQSLIKPTVTPMPGSAGGTVHDAEVTDAVTPGQAQRSKRVPFKALWERTNIYLLLFIFVILIVASVIAVIYYKSRSSSVTPEATIAPQKLSSDALSQLASNGVQIGDPKQVLSIQSNSVFGGTVLVKGELQVAGGLKIGSGGLTIPDLSVGGIGIINQLQTQSLATAGNGAIQGQLTVGKNLSVNGGGSFNGPISTPQLTTSKMQLSGDLQLTRHIVAGGSIPNRTNGNALGNGGTSSLSGSDTAGTISINTGSGSGAGCLVTVTFSQVFTSTPHVIITPVGAAAAGIGYYINRSPSNFSICSANPPPSNQSFGFDYIALD